MTRDDSIVPLLVDTGTPEAEALEHAYAHHISRYLGMPPGSEQPSHAKTIPLPRKGHLLLCTDGLWGKTFAAESLANVLQHAQDQSPGDLLAALRAFRQNALRKKDRDNITGVLVNHTSPAPTTSRSTAKSGGGAPAPGPGLSFHPHVGPDEVLDVRPGVPTPGHDGFGDVDEFGNRTRSGAMATHVPADGPMQEFGFNPWTGRPWRVLRFGNRNQPDTPGNPQPQGGTSEQQDVPEPSPITPDSPETSAAANDSSIEPSGSEQSSKTEPSNDSEGAKRTTSLLSVIRADPAFGIRLATEATHTGGMVLASTAMGLYVAAEAGPVALGVGELITSALPIAVAPFAGYLADHGSPRRVMLSGLGIGSAGALLAIAAVAAQNSYTIPGLVGATTLEVVSNQLYRATMFRYLQEEAGDAQEGLERFHSVAGEGISLAAKGLGPPILALGAAFLRPSISGRTL